MLVVEQVADVNAHRESVTKINIRGEVYKVVRFDHASIDTPYPLKSIHPSIVYRYVESIGDVRSSKIDTMLGSVRE
jgi:hypothetical protein